MRWNIYNRVVALGINQLELIIHKLIYDRCLTIYDVKVCCARIKGGFVEDLTKTFTFLFSNPFDAFFTCLNYLLYECFSSAICNLIHIWCLQNSKFGVNTRSNLDVDKLMVLRLYQNQILNQTSVLTHILTCSSCNILNMQLIA